MQCILCKIYFWKVFHKYYNFICAPICTKSFFFAKSGCYNMLSVELVEGMLSLELMEVGDDWLWCSGKIDNIPEVGLGCFGVFVVGKGKDTSVSIAGGWESTAWYDLVLWWWLLWKLIGFLLHFLLGFKENGATFGAVVSFTAVVRAA
jgi:hypothetical protein